MTLGDIENFEDDLLLFQFQRQVRRNRIGQATCIIDAGKRSQNLRRYLLVQFHILIELLHNRAAHCLDFGFITLLGFNRRQICSEVGIQFADAVDACTLRTFNQHFYRTVRELQHLQNIGNAPDFIDIVSGWFVLGRCLLRGKHDTFALLHGGF